MAASPLGDEVPKSVFWRWVWDSVRPVLGYLFVGVGFLAIILGWVGTANESIVAKQLPYLVSGGLLGIGFLVLGARFLLIEDLRNDSGRLDRLETMVQELHAVLLTQIVVTEEATPARARTSKVSRTTELTVVTPAATAPRRTRAARS